MSLQEIAQLLAQWQGGRQAKYGATTVAENQCLGTRLGRRRLCLRGVRVPSKSVELHCIDDDGSAGARSFLGRACLGFWPGAATSKPSGSLGVKLWARHSPRGRACECTGYSYALQVLCINHATRCVAIVQTDNPDPLNQSPRGSTRPQQVEALVFAWKTGTPLLASTLALVGYGLLANEPPVDPSTFFASVDRASSS